MQQLTDNLWLKRYPLQLLGTQLGRTVTIIRLNAGELIIHSTGPFSATDVQEISQLGRPSALIEATLFHDTFTEAGRAAFPGLPYFAPAKFPAKGGSTQPFSALPGSWQDQLRVLRLAGMPSVNEHAVLHLPSKTLIVADLVFNFGRSASPWTRWFFRWAGGIRHSPGMSRLFRMAIRDRDGFAASVQELMQWDFDRLIVGHGDVIETGGKAELSRALRTARLC